MQLSLHGNERIRIAERTDSNNNCFIDVELPENSYRAISADFYGQNGYIEIRKKDGDLKIYQFKKKSHKKEIDFGYWEDAEVVYSFNREGKDKE